MWEWEHKWHHHKPLWWKTKHQVELAKDIERNHRLGPSKEKKNRGVIIKLTNYDTPDQIYKTRKNLEILQEGAVFAHESLTKTRSGLFPEVKPNSRIIIIDYL